MDSNSSSSPLRGILLDALGTLVELEPPWPHLAAELRERWGFEFSEGEARAGFVAEMTYYRAHHEVARDEDSLAELRERCAASLHGTFPERIQGGVSPAEL